MRQPQGFSSILGLLFEKSPIWIETSPKGMDLEVEFSLD